MEIKKTYREHMPAVKLIGKRYTNTDRDNSGTFASQWQEGYGEHWFTTLAQCKAAPGVSGDPVGAMRGDLNDFTYWIGVFRAVDAEVPEGFESVVIPAGDVGICWLYGDEPSGELYSMEASQLAMGALHEQGWEYDETGWFFERYNTPRFTQPDEHGNVILDIAAYLK